MASSGIKIAFLYLEDGDSTFLRNISNDLPDYTASHSIRQAISSPPLILYPHPQPVRFARDYEATFFKFISESPIHALELSRAAP
jgi:hypothetical protein